MQHSLAAHSVECAQLFDTLSRVLESATNPPLKYAAVEDQYARFRIWAGNLGAFQRLPSEASLDYRLRDSRRTADHVQSLLLDLLAALKDVSAIASGHKKNRTAGNDISEAEELFKTAESTVSSLFRIAVLIRKASPRDRFARALAATKSRFDATFDIRHVYDKFPLIIEKGKDWLGYRLGNAIAQRRQYLSYARSHRDKLGEEPPELLQTHRPSTVDGTKSFTQTIASALNSADIPPQLDFEDERSIASSTLSLPGDNDVSYLRPPALSVVSNGEVMFECPFCWTMQSFRKETSWQKHVYADLRPYVCTFAGCHSKLFSDQREWFEHESEHRMQWHCSLCNIEDMKTENMFRSHILTHANRFTESQLNALSSAARCPPDHFRASDCPFCRTWDEKLKKESPGQYQPTVTPNQFMKHVGSHMRQLALFALPREYVEEVEDTSASSGEIALKNTETFSIARSVLSSTHNDDPDQTGTETNLENSHQPQHTSSAGQATTEDDWDMSGLSLEPGTEGPSQSQDPHSSEPEPAKDRAYSSQQAQSQKKAFVFRIDEIGEHPNSWVNLDSRGHLLPSTGIGCHFPLGGGVSGKYWHCDFQSIQALPGSLPHDVALYGVVSVYYHAGYGFWVMKGDATIDSKEWKPLRFNHDEDDFSSYLTSEGTATTLRCQRPDQHWPRMLLPDIYQTYPMPTHRTYGGLKGNLPLFLALIAFSMSKQDLLHYLQFMSSGDAWQVHGRPHGRFDRRGVVVYVYTCPGTTPEELREYEDGRYGYYYN